eukprot:Clim_evm60s119 gene=Clim_evmTU60s119
MAKKNEIQAEETAMEQPIEEQPLEDEPLDGEDFDGEQTEEGKPKKSRSLSKIFKKKELPEAKQRIADLEAKQKAKEHERMKEYGFAGAPESREEAAAMASVKVYKAISATSLENGNAGSPLGTYRDGALDTGPSREELTAMVDSTYTTPIAVTHHVNDRHSAGSVVTYFDTDEFGFVRHNDETWQQHLDLKDKPLSDQQKEAYEKVLATFRLNYVDADGSIKQLPENVDPTKTSDLKNMCNVGLPKEYRAGAWFELSGGRLLMQKNPGQFMELCNDWDDNADSMERDALESMMRTTFTNNTHFRMRMDPETEDRSFKEDSMRLGRIMAALSRYDENIKLPLQNDLNQVAALLLLVIKDEEKSFWTLTALVSHRFKRFYGPNRNSEFAAVAESIRGLAGPRVSELKSVLNRLTFVETVTTQFPSLFVSSGLPLYTLLRLWDQVICRGEKALVRSIVVLCRIAKDDLLVRPEQTHLLLLSACMRAVDPHTFAEEVYTIKFRSKNFEQGVRKAMQNLGISHHPTPNGAPNVQAA